MKNILFMLTLAFVMLAGYYALAQQTKYTYSAHIQPLFKANCSSCHSWDSAYTSLVGPVSTEPATKGIPIVSRAKPDSSVLVWRLEGKLPSGGSIEQMPKFGSPLSADAIKMVRDWITQGAPESQPVKGEDRSWGAVKEMFR
jgi:mono/diheme cytochrome c family protein